MWKIYESIYIKSKYRPNSSVGGDRNMIVVVRGLVKELAEKDRRKRSEGMKCFFSCLGQ